MSGYRDDQEAARLRIEGLESRVAERDAEIAARDAELGAREQEIARLGRELRRVGTARVSSRRRAPVTGIVVAGAMAAAIGLGAFGFLGVHHEAPARHVEPVVTFTDLPVDRGVEKARLAEKAARGQASRAELQRLQAICARMDDEPCRARAEALLAALDAAAP